MSTDESDWLDDDGYPTDAAIDRIEDGEWTEPDELLEFVASLWHWPDFVTHTLRPEEAIVAQVDRTDLVWRFATGGWSGNELLMRALRSNPVGRICWRLSGSGGLHIFVMR